MDAHNVESPTEDSLLRPEDGASTDSIVQEWECHSHGSEEDGEYVCEDEGHAQDSEEDEFGETLIENHLESLYGSYI